MLDDVDLTTEPKAVISTTWGVAEAALVLHVKNDVRPIWQPGGDVLTWNLARDVITLTYSTEIDVSLVAIAYESMTMRKRLRSADDITLYVWSNLDDAAATGALTTHILHYAGWMRRMTIAGI